MNADRGSKPGGPSRRGLLKAGLAAGAVAGTGAARGEGVRIRARARGVNAAQASAALQPQGR